MPCSFALFLSLSLSSDRSSTCALFEKFPDIFGVLSFALLGCMLATASYFAFNKSCIARDSTLPFCRVDIADVRQALTHTGNQKSIMLQILDSGWALYARTQFKQPLKAPFQKWKQNATIRCTERNNVIIECNSF